ncbi:MAG: hypothetical protein GY774_12310 [Planctomycetes bacterium]|nr:hypothetical protein [Planctomycetota bacterium]
MSKATFYFRFIPAHFAKIGMWVRHRQYGKPFRIDKIEHKGGEESGRIHFQCDGFNYGLSFNKDEPIEIVGKKVGIDIPEEAVPHAQLTEQLNHSGGIFVYSQDGDKEKSNLSPCASPGMTLMSDVIKKTRDIITENNWPFRFIEIRQTIDEDEDTETRFLEDAVFASLNPENDPHSSRVTLKSLSVIKDEEAFFEGIEVEHKVELTDTSRGGLCYHQNAKFRGDSGGWTVNFTVSDIPKNASLSKCASHLGNTLFCMGKSLMDNAEGVEIVNLNEIARRQ